ncbi:hypothetical protein [Geomonas limicola]|nr:hypothetical protein [Geomonas limicola]
MRTVLARIFTLAALMLPAVLAVAQGVPVAASHAVTGWSAGDTAATVQIALQVTNPGNATLKDVSLSVVPMAPVTGGEAAVQVGTLEPRQKRTLSLTLQAHPVSGAKQVALLPLRFTGSYLDEDGTEHAFPVTSFPGGEK